MKKRFTSLAYYALFWLVFFFFARLFFLSIHYDSSFQESFAGVIGSFWHGAKLDISMTGYFILLPILLMIVSVYFNGEWYRLFLRWYTCFLIVISSAIVVSDANLYSYWGFRMDYTPVFYLKTPGEAMASISTVEIVIYFSVFIIVSATGILLYKKFIDELFHRFERVRLWLPAMVSFLLIFGSMIIPIRGGVGIAPINTGSVYFSSRMFLNHAAVNVVWNVGKSATSQKPVENPYDFIDITAAKAIVDSLTFETIKSTSVLNNTRPNIIMIVLEGFSGYSVGPLGGDSLVTPNLNRYIKEGILFTEFYAAANRTDKAMPAILGGYPALPTQSIMKDPKKSQTLPSIVRILGDHGYHSSFWYGGEINFANFNSFVLGSGFQSIITKDNFDKEDYNSKWGVHDHILFKRLKDSLEVVKEPFFNVVLTLSSHEPFDVPMDPVFQGDDNMSKYKNSVYYSDIALGEFLDWARGTEWWNNTLVVILADHCANVSKEIPIYSPTTFKIPMVWIGGAVTEPGSRVEKLGGQIDIPVTILNQLGIPSVFPFGKDLLSDESRSFSYYVYNEGFGFITDTSRYVYDHKLQKPVIIEGRSPEKAGSYGKAFLQVSFDDFLKR